MEKDSSVWFFTEDIFKLLLNKREETVNQPTQPNPTQPNTGLSIFNERKNMVQQAGNSRLERPEP